MSIKSKSCNRQFQRASQFTTIWWASRESTSMTSCIRSSSRRKAGTRRSRSKTIYWKASSWSSTSTNTWWMKWMTRLTKIHISWDSQRQSCRILKGMKCSYSLGKTILKSIRKSWKIKSTWRKSWCLCFSRLKLTSRSWSSIRTCKLSTKKLMSKL